MPDALEEQILDLIETKLETITVANGFATTITDAYRASTGTPPLKRADADRPFIEIRRIECPRRWFIRGAMECRMEIDLVLVTDQNDATIRALMADVLKLIDDNTRWNDGSANLADRTWIVSASFPEPEANLRQSLGFVKFTVKFYEDINDATAVKAI